MSTDKVQQLGRTGSAGDSVVCTGRTIGMDRGFAPESNATVLRVVLRPAGATPFDLIVIPESGLTVGRNVEPFSSESPSIISRLSKEHARIYQEGGQAYVVDLSSLNGTFLNDLKLGHTPARLMSGDDLDFAGIFQFIVDVEEQTPYDLTVCQTYAPIELTLVPETGSATEALVISRFPFLVSRNDEAFQAAKEAYPQAIQELSRRHALITLRGEQLFIEDLGSTNGTFLGETKIEAQPHSINAGDQLRFGQVLSYRVQIHARDGDRTVIASSAMVLREETPARVSRQVVELNIETLAQKGILVPGHHQYTLAREFRRAKRQLLHNLESTPQAKPKNLLLVISALPGEGKTFVALNLALSLAVEMDHQVLLVDCDPATQGLSRLLEIDNVPGVVDKLVAGETDVEGCILGTNVERLHLLPSGTPVEHLDELYASHLMNKLLTGLIARNANLVIVFDGPPLITTSEAAVLARSMGQTILVVEAGKTPTKVVEQAVGQLQGCQCVSGLLNKAKASNIPLF